MSNTLLCTLLNKPGYHKTTTMSGLWRHKWRPIMCVLFFGDFGIEYIGYNHLKHLQTTLTDHYTITEYLNRKKSVIDLRCNYTTNHAQHTYRLSVDGYIPNLILKFGHKAPTEQQLSPHRYRKIIYGSK